MDRVFPIEDLRTLVARALTAGKYAPGESKRVRAIPDTRTIRYYTTLGLIDRPAQMQGRLALYGQKHVLQIVGIKRLQAQGEALAQIQQKLVGATPKKLTQIAALPEDFWDAAEKYLAKPKRKAVAEKPAGLVAATYPLGSLPGPEDFWAAPAAMPSAIPSNDAAAIAMTTPTGACLRITLAPDVELLINLPPGVAPGITQHFDAANLQSASIPLLKELLRQQLISTSPSLSSNGQLQDN
jgi:DNA-binding transcriptional MerR regulator